MNVQPPIDRKMTLPAKHDRYGRVLWFALLCLDIAPVTRAQAPAFQPLNDIALAATAFVETQLRTQDSKSRQLFVAASTLDSRLRLGICSTALEGFSPGALRPGPRVTIGVRCRQPQWTVYVPVAIDSEIEVLVLRQPAARGAALGGSDVEKQTRRLAGLGSQFLTDPAQLQARHLRVPAAAGTALTADVLVPDVLIKRGQRVTLVAAAGGIEVRARGEAVGDATASGRVRVLNLGSHKIVEGQVESVDLVRVSL